MEHVRYPNEYQCRQPGRPHKEQHQRQHAQCGQSPPQQQPQEQPGAVKMAKPSRRSGLRDIVVGGKYRLLSLIGSGSFGQLYRASSIASGEEVAVKLESSSVRYPQLPREAKIYRILHGGVGFPHIHYFGTEALYNVLVLDLLGPTLEDLLNFCARNFSLKTTIMLADQVLARVEYLHMNCLLHRDIKPENFLMGLGSQRNRVFMIDFGLAKRYYRPSTCTHITYNERCDLIGTARYASVHAHYAEQSRRDDLESVGYLLLYFLRGRLPWQGINAQTRSQKYERIAESKSTLPLSVLCAGVPPEFFIYLKYCRSLQFTEQPDYVYLRQLFKLLFRNNYLLNDHLYDWVDIKLERDREKNRKKEEIRHYRPHRRRGHKIHRE